MKRTIFLTFIIVALAPLLTMCAGPDYVPDFFGSGEAGGISPAVTKPQDGTEKSGGNCKVNFEATLCVSIKGEKITVGADGKEPLCKSDVPPIPIEVTNGTDLTIKGSEFPDINFEGGGLPAPITINGKGSTDGTSNVAIGKLDENGNFFLNGFTFFISALGMVGEVPNLVLTTEAIEPLPDLPVISGSPIDEKGHTTMVTGTTLGSLFPAADAVLRGASMTAIFTGKLNPLPSECKGESSKPQSIFITKLVTMDDGSNTEALLPNGNRMEVSHGTFIAENDYDIGEEFSAKAKFKIINGSSGAVEINIPQMAGPFVISSDVPLAQQLPSKKPMTVTIEFRPTTNTVTDAGKIETPVTIGPDTFILVGTAIDKKGKTVIDVVDANGDVTKEHVSKIDLGEVVVETSPRKAFFKCSEIVCSDNKRPTECEPCSDDDRSGCQLLVIDGSGRPIDAVTDGCKAFSDNGARSSINLSAGNRPEVTSAVLAMRNMGPKPLIVRNIGILEATPSASEGQFSIDVEGAFPITLAPYELAQDRLYMTISYHPTDLTGVDGTTASVGQPTKDKAFLHIVTDGIDSSSELVGSTVVREAPSLELFFKTGTGTKKVPDGETIAFRGITQNTSDMGMPLFIQVSDQSTEPVRVASIEIVGDDASFYNLLDTPEKINAIEGAGKCSIPVYDAGGNIVGVVNEPKPIALSSRGYDIIPGSYTADNMPFFGCVNFHKGSGETNAKKKTYKARLKITLQHIQPSTGKPVLNQDGSIKETEYAIELLSVVDPMKGRYVGRMPQTMAVMVNPQFPSIAAQSSEKEFSLRVADGLAKRSDKIIFMSAIVLDPFDEETIMTDSGDISTGPGDGITAIFRSISAMPISTLFDDPMLGSHASLIYDGLAPEGKKGIFFDFPNVPPDFRAGALQIFSSSLSYPGPLSNIEERPEERSQCEKVDPCSPEGQRRHGEGPSDKKKYKGVCAFFYATTGGYDSPFFSDKNDLCERRSEPQKPLTDFKGTYNLNGIIDFPDLGLLLWGPTYVHNPKGPVGPLPSLNELLHLTFTNGVLVPPKKPGDVNRIPDERINQSKREYMVNLDDENSELAPICENNMKNRNIHGELYSSWKYLKSFISKDEETKIPAGCPEDNNDFTGGLAFVHGRPLDQATGITSFVSVSKFSSSDDLSFAFKDLIAFINLNGWLCDPNGSEENFEGAKCYDPYPNERDSLSEISIME